MSYQKVTILGRVGKDPDIRTTGGGMSVANFSVAVDGWAKPGEEKKTEWFNCVAFKAKADVVDQYVKKGDLIFVAGRLQTEKWEDKQGQERTTVKLVIDDLNLIGRTEKRDTSDAEEPRGKTTAKPAARSAPAQEEFDDDIPF